LPVSTTPPLQVVTVLVQSGMMEVVTLYQLNLKVIELGALVPGQGPGQTNLPRTVNGAVGIPDVGDTVTYGFPQTIV
jgi:hypothetical protein